MAAAEQHRRAPHCSACQIRCWDHCLHASAHTSQIIAVPARGFNQVHSRTGELKHFSAGSASIYSQHSDVERKSKRIPLHKREQRSQKGNLWLKLVSASQYNIYNARWKIQGSTRGLGHAQVMGEAGEWCWWHHREPTAREGSGTEAMNLKWVCNVIWGFFAVVFFLFVVRFFCKIKEWNGK